MTHNGYNWGQIFMPLAADIWGHIVLRLFIVCVSVDMLFHSAFINHAGSAKGYTHT